MRSKPIPLGTTRTKKSFCLLPRVVEDKDGIKIWVWLEYIKLVQKRCDCTDPDCDQFFGGPHWKTINTYV